MSVKGGRTRVSGGWLRRRREGRMEVQCEARTVSDLPPTPTPSCECRQVVPTVLGHQHVGPLDVTVHDTGGVKVGQACQHLRGRGEGRGDEPMLVKGVGGPLGPWAMELRAIRASWMYPTAEQPTPHETPAIKHTHARRQTPTSPLSPPCLNPPSKHKLPHPPPSHTPYLEGVGACHLLAEPPETLQHRGDGATWNSRWSCMVRTPVYRRDS